MTRPVRFGVTLPQIKRSWSEASETARALDAMGYDSLWVCDHLYGVPMPNLPILEAFTELAAVAAITQRAKLGTLVTPPFFRNPAVLAKQIATLDQIAPGRVIAGLGAGWFPPEFEQTGCAFPSTGERLRALEEMVEILTRLWTEEKATYAGRYFSVTDAICEPKPSVRPEILIGGGGEKVTMAIAARHADTWNNMAIAQAQLAKKVEALRRRCDEVGRDFDSIEKSQQCVVVIAEDETAARASLEKAKKIYGGHMGGALEEHGIWGSPERVIDCIERHRALGVSLLVIEFFGRDTREPARLFAEAVAPAFA
ncbi:MAG: TIGR03560 family F420-dependent LLM class oxidoreductase [Spirochaetaceae bacterium]|nr:TIGR03560 family F420-dependent LLM class oxidoreductase [Myxococcales bacterium]MCB9722423.1 TIGR03560 family F420-dependent LLM class oxidoreductase [Spirochaetaceae bacterium]HPG27096.1 TIGR03560 family F420-dependent LLM class oxidoreductase [Myxococcota bacterium]